MNFINRLKYYLIGVGLGILLVLAIFKDRKLTNWTPQNQVKIDLKEKSMHMSPYVQCLFSCIQVQDKDSIRSLLQIASVDFKTSDVSNHEQRKYVLEFEELSLQKAFVTIEEKDFEITGIEIKDEECACSESGTE